MGAITPFTTSRGHCCGALNHWTQVCLFGSFSVFQDSSHEGESDGPVGDE